MKDRSDTMSTDWAAVRQMAVSPLKQYEQFILFGDSITEFSCCAEFGLTPALQEGKEISLFAHVLPSILETDVLTLQPTFDGWTS